MAEALENRASLRRFCGFAAQEPTPERTAFVRLGGRSCGEVLPNDPGEVYADSAYYGTPFAFAVQAKGGSPRGSQIGM